MQLYGVTVTAAVLLTPLEVAVIVTILVEPIGLVFTEKVAAALPAGTMIDAGTVAKVLLLDSVTTAPPAGAVLARVTVPVTAAPLVTLAGERATEDSAGAVTTAVTLSPAVLFTPL